jgi:hypothetical protein
MEEDGGSTDKVIGSSFSHTYLDRTEDVVVHQGQCIMKHLLHGGDLRWASSASFSTRLKLTSEDAKLGEPGQDRPGSSGLMTPKCPGVGTASPGAVLPTTLAPTTMTPVAPCEALPALGTSSANATTGRQWTTGANKVRLLPPTQCFLQNLSLKIIKVGTSHRRS